jgi:hypothetical protein
MGYRRDLDNATVLAEESDIDKTEFITYNDAKNIIDSIEQEVNEIKDKLKPYTVFSELEEVYDMINELSKKLY